MKRKHRTKEPRIYKHMHIYNPFFQHKMTEDELKEQNIIVETMMNHTTHLEDREILTCINGILEERIERSGKAYY